MAHIQHADLRKATGGQIKNELEYLLNIHIPQIIKGIEKGLLQVVSHTNPDLPLWMSNRDLAGACDRVQAIIEEIKFRSEI